MYMVVIIIRSFATSCSCVLTLCNTVIAVLVQAVKQKVLKTRLTVPFSKGILASFTISILLVP